jgi:hypothetical protein
MPSCTPRTESGLRACRSGVRTPLASHSRGWRTCDNVKLVQHRYGKYAEPLQTLIEGVVSGMRHPAAQTSRITVKLLVRVPGAMCVARRGTEWSGYVRRSSSHLDQPRLKLQAGLPAGVPRMLRPAMPSLCQGIIASSNSQAAAFGVYPVAQSL